MNAMNTLAKIKEFVLKYQNIFLFIFAIILISIPYLWYLNKVILGGELGSIPLNLELAKSNHSYIWNDGLYGGYLNSLYFVDIFPQNAIFFLLSKIGFGLGASIRVYYIFLHTLTFLGAFLLAQKIFNRKFKVSILVGLFYSLNFYYFSQLDHQFQLLASAFAPYFLLFTIDYFEKPRIKKVIIFQIAFLFFFLAAVHTIPCLLITVFPVALYLIINFFYQNDKKEYGKLIFAYLWQNILFFALFNSWWLLNFLLFVGGLSGSASNYGQSLSWLSFSSPARFVDVFRNLGYWVWQMPEYVIFQDKFYTGKIYQIIEMLFVILGICTFLIKSKSKFLLFFRLSFILIFFFIMGPNFPVLGKFFVFLYGHVPFFNTFQNTYYKFSWIYVLALSFLLGYFFLNSKRKKLVFAGLIVLNLIMIGQYLTGKWIVKENNYGAVSVDKIPDAYYAIDNYLKENKSDSRLLGYPQSQYGYYYDWGTYLPEITGRIFQKPQLFLTTSGYIFGKGYSNIVDTIYKNSSTIQDQETFEKILGLLNVKQVYIDNTLRDVMLYNSPGKILEAIQGDPNFTQALKMDYVSSGFKNLTGWYVFNLNSKYQLGHFYASSKVLLDDGNFDIKKLMSQCKLGEKCAIFSDKAKDLIPSADEKQPLIEYKKISPVKYRLVIHKASDAFPLVFSESFHKGWRVYLDKSSVKSAKDLVSEADSQYKPLKGNEQDQASKSELVEYINDGLISTLGDGTKKNINHTKWQDGKEVIDQNEPYQIDFISKNMNGTIQNNNLLNGPVNETIFKKPIVDDTNHLEANGYANSWIIDPREVCSKGNCVKNGDGSYDLGLVVEFWPQRLFYFGLAVLCLALLGSGACLFYYYLGRKKHGAKAE